jgi:hypothetical protein
MPIATDAGLVAQRLPQRLPKANPHILDRVMLIDVQITGSANDEINRRVLCQERQHVVEKTNARGHIRLPLAIELKGKLDVRFGRLAMDSRGSWHGRLE